MRRGARIPPDRSGASRDGGPGASGAGGSVPVRTDGGTPDVSDVGKLVRLATMTRIQLDQANAVELDGAARKRLTSAHNRSVTAMAEVLSDELRDELADLQPLFTGDGEPTAGELRVAQAQLVGWLEGLLQGIRVTLLSQHLASEDELAQVYGETLREEVTEQRDGGGRALHP